MSSSRIRTSFALFQRPKARWPDPEKSIGAIRGIKNGKFNCWAAKGPAKEAFEQVRPAITEELERHCGPVPSSSWVQFDIFMIGGTKATAVPHIMFSCKRPEPRKSAVAAIKRSNILDECPPGIHLGHWDCPPHLKDLRFLASATSYGYSDSYTSQDHQPTSSFHTNELNSVPRLYSVGSGQALQLARENTSMMPASLRRATIGGIVPISDRRFYLAPEHFYYSEAQYSLENAPERDSELEDSECEFEGLDDRSEGTSNSQEVEFMSQYSLTPESSDLEEYLDLDEHDSATDSTSDHLTFRVQTDRQSHGNATPEDDAAYSMPDNIHGSLLLDATFTEAEVPYLKSAALDYCLIEIKETEHCPPDLPVFARENIGQLQSGSVNVLAATGSGNVLKGVLFSGLSCVRPPNAARYMNVLTVQFEGSLQPGDSGSIVRDIHKGTIYGHIVAGDTSSQTALIIPAFDVLNDIVAKTYAETLSAQHNSSKNPLPTLPSLELRSYGSPDGQSSEFTRHFGVGNSLRFSAMKLDQPEADTGAGSPLPEGDPGHGNSKLDFDGAAALSNATSIPNPAPIQGGINHQTIARQRQMFSMPVQVNHTERLEIIREEMGYIYRALIEPATEGFSEEDLGLVTRHLGRVREVIKKKKINDMNRVSKARAPEGSISPAAQNSNKANGKESFRCLKCGTKFRIVASLQRHIEDLHHPCTKFRCPMPNCVENFHRRDKVRNHCLVRHERRATDEEIKQCTHELPSPTHCSICTSIVSEWRSFYKCFISHCRIENISQGEATTSKNDVTGPGPAPANFSNFPGSGAGDAGMSFARGHNNYSRASKEQMNDNHKDFESQCHSENTSQEEELVFETEDIDNEFLACFDQTKATVQNDTIRAYISAYDDLNSLGRAVGHASAGHSNSTTGSHSSSYATSQDTGSTSVTSAISEYGTSLGIATNEEPIPVPPWFNEQDFGFITGGKQKN